MKRSVVKAISLCLCGTLVAGCVGVHALASGNETAEPVKPVQISAAAPMASQPSAKDETVYVLAKADGTVEKSLSANGSRMPTAAHFWRTLPSWTVWRT